MGSKALQTLRAGAHGHDRRAARKGVLDSFAAATDNWTRSALVAAATEQAPAYVAEALTYDRPQALTDFVVAVLPAALPAHAARLLVARRPARAGRGRAQGQHRASDCPDGRRGDCAGRRDDRALQTLLDDPDDKGRARCRSWRSGTRPASLRPRPTATRQLMLRELGDAAASDERRIDSAGEPAAGAGAPCAGALRDRADAVGRRRCRAALKGRLDRRARRQRRRAMSMPCWSTALARTNSTLVFDQLAEASGFLARVAGGDEGRDSHRGEARPRQRRAAAHASQPSGRDAGRRAPRHAVAGRESQRATSSRRCFRKSRSQVTPRRAGRCSSAPARAATSWGISERAMPVRR